MIAGKLRILNSPDNGLALQTTLEFRSVNLQGEQVQTEVADFSTEGERRAFILGAKKACYLAGILVDDPVIVDPSPDHYPQLPFCDQA